MSDPPGVQAALGIEAVEWSADGEHLIVRITGRWRRRRPAYGGQPTLVVESHGHRHRFPATPEPPGLTGTAPGIWQIGFTVPAALAPELATRSWLLIGGVVVRLPEAVEAAHSDSAKEERATAEGGSSAGVQLDLARPADLAPPERAVAPPERAASPERLSQAPAISYARRAELAANELAGRIEEFERMLAEARVESGRLLRRLADRGRERRAVEQLAHAERVRRLEVEEELAVRERDAQRSRLTLAELAATEDRVRQLEQEMAAVRRQADEAEQVVAAADVARARAERRGEELALAEERRCQRALADEHELVALRAEADSRRRVPAEPAEPAEPERPERAPPSADPVPAAARLEPVVEALKAEIETRAASEARLRARLGVAEGRFETRVDTEAELAATLAQLRAELASLHTDLEHERAARARAERHAAELQRALGEQRVRTDRANTAIEELREALEGLRAAPAQAQAPNAGASLEPERFSDALVRLRETIAPADGGEPPAAADSPAGQDLDVPNPGQALDDPAPAEEPDKPQAPRVHFIGRPWLGRVFTTLTRRDAARAGRMLLDLLPAQGASYHGSVAYDLVLGRDVGTLAVTLREGQLELTSRSWPREAEAVDFQVFGSPGRIARLLTAGWVRRRTRLGLARVRGDREHVAALAALVHTPLSLAELHDAGVRMDPQMALTLVSLMIERSWTKGHKFTLALEEAGAARAFLKVRSRSRPVVLDSMKADRVTTTVVAGPQSLLAVLAGEWGAAAEVRGDEQALSTLLEWIKRAQCG